MNEQPKAVQTTTVGATAPGRPPSDNMPTRKPNRLKHYDYSKNGAYFVTVCTKDRKPLLGSVIVCPKGTDGAMPTVSLSKLGRCVDRTIRNIGVGNCNDVRIESYIIMPNHFHMIVHICSDAGDRGRSPLQHVVRSIKSYVSRQAGFGIWQKSFYDHVIRGQRDYSQVAEYIENNPARWLEDCYYMEQKMI